MQLVIGTSIGAYVLEKPLGSGAFGVVWLARRGGAGGGLVAIKVLHATAALSEESVERFRREAYVLSRLKSRHIAQLYEFYNSPMALVMEYVEGPLLSQVVEARRFSVEEGVALGTQCLRGVVEMHANGIIHRDLKPGNVILRPTAEGPFSAVIFDFNLSRLKAKPAGGVPGGNLTSTRSAIGTLPFMPPEQLVDARRVTELADVYSIGAILYRAVSGDCPFKGTSVFKEKLSTEAPPLVTGRTDQRAFRFERVVARALMRRPQDRFQSAQEMLAALESIDA